MTKLPDPHRTTSVNDERLTKLEISALVAALAGSPDETVRRLVNKIPTLKVTGRKVTGVGFFTKFISTDLESARRDRTTQPVVYRPLPDAFGFHPDPNACAFFLVYLEDGHIECLEAASIGSWPIGDETSFVVTTLPETAKATTGLLPDIDKLTSAQTLCMLAAQEAQLRELFERVKLQDEMIDALGAGLAKLCETFPDEGAEIAARIRDLMLDRKKLIDRAQPL